MTRTLRRGVAALLVLALGSSVGCGTIFYPERRGQAAGKLDADIVILDAVGLIFFLVPGVIAFAVDFATGTIYLPPGGKSRSLQMLGDAGVERHALTDRSAAGIEAAIREHTGLVIDLRDAEVVVPADAAIGVETELRRLQGDS